MATPARAPKAAACPLRPRSGEQASPGAGSWGGRGTRRKEAPCHGAPAGRGRDLGLDSGFRGEPGGPSREVTDPGFLSGDHTLAARGAGRQQGRQLGGSASQSCKRGRWPGGGQRLEGQQGVLTRCVWNVREKQRWCQGWGWSCWSRGRVHHWGGGWGSGLFVGGGAGLSLEPGLPAQCLSRGAG